MFIIGLTGSLGMGKSTAARFFAEQGVPVHDADAVVHQLYDGEAAAAIEAAFPGTVTNGKVDRSKLAALALADPAALKKLEAIVHPLVLAAEQKLIAEAQLRGEKLRDVARTARSQTLLDRPLINASGFNLVRNSCRFENCLPYLTLRRKHESGCAPPQAHR